MEEWQIQLLKDSKLIRVLDKQFDEEKFILDILNRSTTAEVSEIFTKLSNAKQDIAQSFSNTIKDNYNRLIDDFQNIKDLNFEITDCRVRVQSIQKMLAQINSSFIQNYESIQSKAPVLKNTTDALSLTRASLKFLQNFKKLKLVVGPKLEILDLNKACLIIKEIIKVISEQSLEGVEFYERERDFIDEVREKIIAINDKKFLESINSKNVVDITHCIQNFYNLRILTERVQTAATTIMKTIFELWKKFVHSEYDKGYNGLIVVGNNAKSLLQEQLNYHTQIWLVSTILRKRDSNSLDSFFEYMKEGKIVNLYDEVWKKQIVIMNHHLKHLKEDNPKDTIYENNKILFTRIYPKVYFLFEDFLQNLSIFMLKHPDPHEIKDMITFREPFMDAIAPFATMYFDFIRSHLEQRFQAASDYLHNADANQFKNYIGGVLSEVAKLGQFVNFEVKDNIKTALIFKKFAEIVLDISFENLTQVFKRYDETDVKKLSLNKIFAILTYQYEIRKALIIIAMQKFNEEISLEKLDRITSLCEKYEQAILEVIFQTLFENSHQILKQIYLYHRQELSAKVYTQHGYIDSLEDLLMNYSPASNPKLDGCGPFAEYWSRLNFVILSQLALIFSSFSEKTDRVLEMMNKDVENMGRVVDSLNKKDVMQRLLLINIQKLILMDANNLKYFIENKHEFVKNMPKTILGFNLLKRTEREAYTYLYQVTGKTEERSLDDIMDNYFGQEKGESRTWNIDNLTKALQSVEVIKEDIVMVIKRIKERPQQHLDKVPTLPVLSLFLDSN